MKSFILVCAVCLHLRGSYGSDDNDGVGAFAYQDSTGNRYGGTYGLRGGQVVDQRGTFPPNFSPPTFQDLDDFFPEYLFNLQNVLQEAFLPPPPFIRQSPIIRNPYFRRHFRNRTFESIENQKLAYDAARKAYDLTSNQAGYIPNFASRFPFNNDFPGFGGFPGMPAPGFPAFPGIQMPNFGRSANSAYAAAAIGPDYSQQIADINPPNPNNPNINKVNKISSGPGGYKSVSSSSSVSTSDVNGQKISSRRAETTVNNDGEITSYKVES